MARCLDLEHCVESSPQLYKLVLWGFYFSLYIVKNKQQVQNGIIYAKPHSTKPKLNYSFSSPRNGILNQSIRNCLVSSREKIYLTDPLPSPRGK